MLNERTFDANGVSINFVEGPPSGPPLVMLHGGTDQWQTFQPVIPELSDRLHVYALDFRGHGKSGRARGEYRIPDYSKDVVEFIRERIGAPAILMGHSMGADASLWIAANAPDTVRAAILEEPLYSHNGTRLKDFSVYKSLLVFREALPSSTSSVEQIASAIKAARPNWPESLVQSKAECLSLLDPDTLTLIVEGHHTDGYDTEDLLPRISAPMLLIQGDPLRGG
ncbi:MAG: alpha/beta hydrolase, partial [Chloroflexi bacterium]|nr:alpha/beta hydrolase [Chloroflexota bacterium]